MVVWETNICCSKLKKAAFITYRMSLQYINNIIFEDVFIYLFFKFFFLPRHSLILAGILQFSKFSAPTIATKKVQL